LEITTDASIPAHNVTSTCEDAKFYEKIVNIEWEWGRFQPFRLSGFRSGGFRHKTVFAGDDEEHPNSGAGSFVTLTLTLTDCRVKENLLLNDTIRVAVSSEQ
jgi:hypothetical protein